MGVDAPILVDLILSGDQDAVAGYYDGRAPSVYQYCAQLCPGPAVEEAVLASFADFLGRARSAGADADLDDLLRKSARIAAASRMQVGKSRDPICRSMPDLIAARANEELPYSEEGIVAHIRHCRTCRQTAQRLIEAEDALVQPASRQAPEEIRTAWLLIASKGAGPERSAEASAQPASEAPAPEPEPRPAAPEPTPQPSAPEPPPEPAAEEPPAPVPEPPVPPPVRVRRRTGGLVGAARRVARGR